MQYCRGLGRENCTKKSADFRHAPLGSPQTTIPHGKSAPIVRPQWKLLLTHILFRGGDSEAIELNTLFICAKAQHKCKNNFQFNL